MKQEMNLLNLELVMLLVRQHVSDHMLGRDEGDSDDTAVHLFTGKVIGEVDVLVGFV
jgi:hypothetical protein